LLLASATLLPATSQAKWKPQYASNSPEILCRHSYQAPDRRTHRLPWNYRGEAPERVPTFQRGHIFPRRLLRQCGPAQMRGRSFYLRNPDNRIL
jgi:hypothetical protein